MASASGNWQVEDQRAFARSTSAHLFVQTSTLAITRRGRAVANFEAACFSVLPDPLAEQIDRPARRILHLINGQYYSGAERVQDLLAAALPEYGYEVGFVCLKPCRFPEVRRCRTAPLYTAPMRSRFDFGVIRQVYSLLTEQRYALVHAHTPRTLLVARLAAARAGVPVVYHVHSPTARDSTRWLTNRLNAVAERLALPGTVRVITVSHSLARHMAEIGCTRDQIRVVPNGVPPSRVLREPKAPQAPWTLLTVALFRPRKGTEVLLEAMALLRRQGYSVQLRAIGGFETPEYERHLRQLTGQLHLDTAAQWMGFQEDVATHLAHADVFVLPSLFGEGLPMVILEAMAAGVPIVGTNVEGIPEAIRHGREGLIARPADPGDLAEKIALLIRGEVDWLQLRHQALLRQHAEFSDQSMARGVAAVYDQILTDVGYQGACPRMAKPSHG